MSWLFVGWLGVPLRLSFYLCSCFPLSLQSSVRHWTCTSSSHLPSPFPLSRVISLPSMTRRRILSKRRYITKQMECWFTSTSEWRKFLRSRRERGCCWYFMGFHSKSVLFSIFLNGDIGGWGSNMNKHGSMIKDAVILQLWLSWLNVFMHTMHGFLFHLFFFLSSFCCYHYYSCHHQFQSACQRTWPISTIPILR
jgi:hypothetical protein